MARTNEELAFAKKYVQWLAGKKTKRLFAGDEEFFERDTGHSLAARLVDQKAFKTLSELAGEAFSGFEILAIGAGGGREAIWLLKQGARKVVCLDISEALLGLAKKRLRGKPVDFVIANAEELPFKDNCFDLAFFFASLHHIDHPQKALVEASRVARRVALASEPAGLGFLERILAFVGWNVEYGQLTCHRLAPNKIKKILAKRGFGVRFKTNFIWFPFKFFHRWKNSQLFLQFYFWFLSGLDAIFGFWGHNLTVFAQRQESFKKT